MKLILGFLARLCGFPVCDICGRVGRIETDGAYADGWRVRATNIVCPECDK